MATPSQVTATTPQSRAQTAGNAHTASKLPFKIEPARGRHRYLNLLVYGEYGVGKTTLIGTGCDVPQMHDTIMIDAESGDLSLDDHENLDVVRVQNFGQAARVHEYLVEHCRARDAGNLERLAELEQRLKGLDQPPSEPKQYRTVLLDSLTEIESYNMYGLLGITDSTRLDDDVATAEWTEYKRNHTAIQRLVRQYRDLPMHFLCACAAQFTQDEQKRRAYVPQLTGKLSKQIQGFFDMVGFLVVGSGEDGSQVRRLYVQPSSQGRYDAKNRFSRYKKTYFDNPTMELILSECGLKA